VLFCRNDFNIAVLKAFVNLSDFTGMILVQALRLFLSSVPPITASQCLLLCFVLLRVFLSEMKLLIILA